MKLYHGTNADIDAIDLNRGLRHKDFGKGFYLTPDLTTAIRMAQKKTRLFGGKATLITYEMDEAALHSDLKVKIFPEKACVEWLSQSPMNTPNHHQIANYLTDYVLSELVKYVKEDTNCSIEQAMEQVYNSPLMTALQDEECELYVQSPAYLYELMGLISSSTGSTFVENE